MSKYNKYKKDATIERKVLEQYGLGGYLKENAGAIGGLLGTVGGSLIGMPGLGTAVGSGIGGLIQGAGAGQEEPIDDYQVVPLRQQFNPTGGTFAMGGNTQELTEYNGATHEQGGIQQPFGEVEGGETKISDYIFSDRILVDPKGKKTFADESKRINKKYEKRKDHITKRSLELELGTLRDKQEQYKQSMGETYAVDGQEFNGQEVQQFSMGGKINIKPENRGKFTESAKRAGMGVQEFAKHVLANKGKYTSTQIKRANFAKNAAGWNYAYGGYTNKKYAEGGWREDLYGYSYGGADQVINALIRTVAIPSLPITALVDVVDPKSNGLEATRAVWRFILGPRRGQLLHELEQTGLSPKEARNRFKELRKEAKQQYKKHVDSGGEPVPDIDTAALEAAEDPIIKETASKAALPEARVAPPLDVSIPEINVEDEDLGIPPIVKEAANDKNIQTREDLIKYMEQNNISPEELGIQNDIPEARVAPPLDIKDEPLDIMEEDLGIPSYNAPKSMYPNIDDLPKYTPELQVPKGLPTEGMEPLARIQRIYEQHRGKNLSPQDWVDLFTREGITDYNLIRQFAEQAPGIDAGAMRGATESGNESDISKFFGPKTAAAFNRGNGVQQLQGKLPTVQSKIQESLQQAGSGVPVDGIERMQGKLPSVPERSVLEGFNPIAPELSNFKYSAPHEDGPNNKFMGMLGNFKGSDAGQFLASNMGDIYNLGRGIVRSLDPKKPTLERVLSPTMQRIDPTEGVRQLQQQGANIGQAMTQSGNLSQGQLMANLAGAQRGTQGAMSQYLQGVQGQNIGIGNQEARMRLQANAQNAGIQQQEEDLRAREADIANNMIQHGLTGLSEGYDTMRRNKITEREFEKRKSGGTFDAYFDEYMRQQGYKK